MTAGFDNGTLAKSEKSASKTDVVTKKEPKLTSPKVLKEDLSIFYRDLQGIPVYSGSGGIGAIGEKAFPVVAPEANPSIAAARYGKGRIVAAGSDQYFDLSRPHEDEEGIVTRNILLWLTDEAHTNKGKGNDRTNRYEDALKGKGKKIRLVTTSHSFTVDPSLPIEVVKVDSWASAKLNPQKYAVAYVDASMKDKDLKNLDKYVRKGGAVIVAEKGRDLVSITRHTPLDERLRIGNYRGSRLSQNFAVQKLLNRAGLTLLNSGVSTNNNPPEFTYEDAYNSHFLNRIQQAKALEEGTLSIDDIEIGLPNADANKKQKLLADVIIETLETLSSESQLYAWAESKAEKLEPAIFPINRSEKPYTNALYDFQFSHFTLDPNNTKSPYADDFPGKVSEDAEIVNNKEVEVNFDFLDTMYTRALPNKNWVSTGLYAPPGSVVEVDVPEGTENLTVQIGSHDDDLRGLSQWKRVPLLVDHKKLTPGKNRVNSPYGGMIYLIPMKPKEDTKVTVKINGAVQAPYYVLGETTQEEWDKMRNAPTAPFAELKSDNIVLTVPSETITDLEDPKELMETWDEIVESYDELVGVSPEKEMPNTADELPHYYVADRQIKGGALHAGYPIMLTVDRAERLLNVDYVRTKAWGFWHELGHEYQQSPWLWGDVWEVTVNIYSLYIQEKFGNPSELLTEKDGKDYYDRAFEFLNSNNLEKEYNDIGNYERLVMFKQLQLAYSWDFYTDVHTYYREMPDDQLPQSTQEQIDTFVVTASKLSGENLLEFFEKWAVGYSDKAREKVEAMNLPQPDEEVWKLREQTETELTPEEVLKEDFEVFYRDLEGIPSYSSTHAGGVSAIKGNAFVVATNPNTSPLIAASRYDKGRVVAAGMSEYLDFSGTENIKSTLTRNVLTWLTEQHQGEGQPVSYEEALNGEGKIKLITNWDIGVSDELPIEVKKVDNFLSEDMNPNLYQVAYVNNFNMPLSDEEVEALLNYIKDGGAVLFAMKGWVMDGYPKDWMKEKIPNARLYDYGIQKLLNEVGISLMNNIAATKNEMLPPLSYDKANNYHILRLIDQAKAVENGTLLVDEIDIGYPDADDEKKKEIIATIVSGTIGSLTSSSPLLEQIRGDAQDLEVTWPFEKGKFPYSSALLSYQVNQVSLDPNQTKSPFADVFPGVVPADTPIVDNKEIVVDFDYDDLSHLRMLYPPGNWHSTGLYAPAGSVVTIEVPEGTENLDVQIGAHTDNLSGKTTWERVPVVALRKELQPGTNKIVSPYGGLIYLIPTKSKADTEATVSISGAVNAPYFVLGETTNEEWNNTIKNYQAPWAELQGEHVILTLPTDVIKNVDNPEELMTKWDQMIGKYNELVGVGPNKPLPHRSPDRPHRYVFDIQISNGLMHAGYPIMAPIQRFAEEAVDLSKGQLGSWGFWHEMGHEYQQTPWTWGDITEVSVNIHSLHVQEYFGLKSNLLTKDDEGKDYYDKAFEYLNSTDPNKKFTSIGLMERLVLFGQLKLAYGWDFYTNLNTAYRELPQDQMPKSDQEEMDLLVLMASKLSGENLLSFFEKWEWHITEDTRTKIESMNLPKPETPVWTLREKE